jgi:serine protease Do
MLTKHLLSAQAVLQSKGLAVFKADRYVTKTAPIGCPDVEKKRQRPSMAAPSPRSTLYPKALIGLVLLPFLAATPSFADDLPDFQSLVQEEGDAVVKIAVTGSRTAAVSGGVPGIDPDQLPESLRRFFEQAPGSGVPERRQPTGGFGSGFIISDDGYVITNAHVVEGADNINVTLENRRQYEAELIGADEASDIAVLKIDAAALPTVRIGDSDELNVGEWVLAIGSPYGFEHTATQGIVSAVARSLPNDTYVPFIQTDAAVNPGNSGGPLFNTDGEVIGVNSQIYSRSGGYQGLSFAIPINVAMSIAEQIREVGFATRGWLGVTIQDVDQSLAESFGLKRPEGALVADIGVGSPAASGGIERGDIILEFNGQPVDYSSSLPPLVGSVRPGTDVEVVILRDSERRTLEVTIEPLEQDQRVAAASQDIENETLLGMAVASLNADEREALGIESGVVVSDVTAGSAAADAGIRGGDVIVSFDRVKVETPDELRGIIEGSDGGKSVPVLIQRQGSPMFLALGLPGADG